MIMLCKVYLNKPNRTRGNGREPYETANWEALTKKCAKNSYKAIIDYFPQKVTEIVFGYVYVCVCICLHKTIRRTYKI